MFRRKQRNKDIEKVSADIRKSCGALDDITQNHDFVSDRTSIFRSRSASIDAHHQCRHSELKDFPVNVRKSLMALDQVLESFDDDTNISSRGHSAPVLRSLLGKLGLKKNKERETMGEYRRSLIDNVSGQCNDAITVSSPNTRSTNCLASGTKRNDDVRRSLEILDNVLAQFDDPDIFGSAEIAEDGNCVINGCNKGSQPSITYSKKARLEDENGNNVKETQTRPQPQTPTLDRNVPSVTPSPHLNTDGSTTEQLALDESRRCSAPPVPKRNPRTRLSNKDRPLFSKEEADDSDDDEMPPLQDTYVSLSSIQLTSPNDESSSPLISELKRKAALFVPTPCTSTSSPLIDNSPISNHLRHDVITTHENQSLEFYLVRDGDDVDDDVFLSTPVRGDTRKITTCRVCGKGLANSTATSNPAMSCDTSMSLMDSDEFHRQRRMALDQKFEKVKLLLRTNQVTGLNKPPPSFKPLPSPPRYTDKIYALQKNAEPSNTPAQRSLHHVELLEESLKDALSYSMENFSQSNVSNVQHEADRINKANSPSGGSFCKDETCTRYEQKPNFKSPSCLRATKAATKPEINGDRGCDRSPTEKKFSPGDVLCNNCINKGWTFRNVELVTSTPSSLKRPPLGLSYSMEDDLSPGIKEITSSPSSMSVDAKCDSLISSSKSSPVAHLSTFSHSVSSLGDGSSQSELDFTTSLDSGKIPLTSIKSLTLPTDMKLGPSPFYCAMEGDDTGSTDHKLLRINDLEDVRSSSAPPPLQENGHWKKGKTGLLKRNTHAMNDGFGSSIPVSGEDDATTGEKPKKRSVWKSILRRK